MQHIPRCHLPSKCQELRSQIEEVIINGFDEKLQDRGPSASSCLLSCLVFPFVLHLLISHLWDQVWKPAVLMRVVSQFSPYDMGYVPSNISLIHFSRIWCNKTLFFFISGEKQCFVMEQGQISKDRGEVRVSQGLFPRKGRDSFQMEWPFALPSLPSSLCLLFGTLMYWVGQKVRYAIFHRIKIFHFHW